MKVEITISAKENGKGWDNEAVRKIIEFDCEPFGQYPVGTLVEKLIKDAMLERQDKLDSEEKAEEDAEEGA